MKNIYPIIASAVLGVCLAGCNTLPNAESPGAGIAHVKVSVSGLPLTRVTGVSPADEVNISSLQLFVFDGSGSLEYYVDAGASATGTIAVKEGKKTVTAVINAPSLSDIRSRSALLTRSTLLSDNAVGSFVMTGEVEAVLQDGGKLSIEVSRIISKVTIKKITSNFTSQSDASKTFKINSIYLINVAGDNTYAASSEPTMWYNKLGNGQNDASLKSVPFLSDPVGKTVAYKSSYSVEHSFYCYPNLISTESFTPNWSPRHTMLVIDASLGGVQTYYPIELPVIGRNKSIVVENLVITRKGSDYPYIPVPNGCDATVTVLPWDEILNYTETI